MSDEFNMTVSPVYAKNGEKYAFVSFTDGKRTAEGKIPDCKVISSVGFDEAEVRMLENYMREDLSHLKQVAAGIRIIDAIMK
ncbi:MAG: hypothetical protein E7266_04470 [Lachnospiraceae bacterium]|nr:hypothetical protein [Lachnospiraceae bacterium]